MYRSEQQVSTLFSAFAMLAIVISCLACMDSRPTSPNNARVRSVFGKRRRFYRYILLVEYTLRNASSRCHGHRGSARMVCHDDGSKVRVQDRFQWGPVALAGW